MSIGRRLAAGFLAVLVLSALGVGGALWAARTTADGVRRVGGLVEDGRRLSRVGALVREFYMHQAHLALGMTHAEHLGLARQARADLGVALEALRAAPTPGPRTLDDAALAARVAELDRLFEQVFLPAMRKGDTMAATHAHHLAAGAVQALVDALEADGARISAAIHHAEEQADARATRAVWLSAALLGGALLLALAVAWATTRAVTGPVARLRDAAARLAGAEPGTRVPEGGPPEVAALGRTLNAMLVDLEAQRRARAEAETLAALGRVAGGIAHEINNPLGVILGHARLIERGGGPAAEDAAAIARETRACKGIVEALLDYARPGLLKRAPVDLAALAWEVVDRHPGATLEAAGEVVVPGDARRLGQVLDNLVRNGLAFGAAVAVEVAAAHGGARVTVRDDGPGVAGEDVERVFEPFFSTRADGTGLGLAIAHSVVLAHGGSIAARPGPGGHFTLTLPGEEAHGPHPGD